MFVKFGHLFFDTKEEFNDWVVSCNLNIPVYISISSHYPGFDYYKVNNIVCYVPIIEQLSFF